MANKIIIGIDPGWTGAISVYKNFDCIKVVDSPPNIEGCYQFIHELQCIFNPSDYLLFGSIELIHAFPGFDIMSQESLIRSHQTWKTLLEIYTTDYVEVAPVTWQNNIIGKVDHANSDELREEIKFIKANKDILIADETDKTIKAKTALWKKMRKQEIKDASIEKAKTIFPSCEFVTVGPKGGIKKHHDRADAVCIGLYGANHFMKELF